MEVAENFNKEEIQMQTTQCTKVGDNGEVITVSITTEESHQAQVLGKSPQVIFQTTKNIRVKLRTSKMYKKNIFRKSI